MKQLKTETKVGDIKVTIISDGHLDLPIGMFPNAPAELTKRLGETLRVGANIWLVEAGERSVLIDTSSGDALKQMFPETGHARAMIDENSVTDIVLTHMHPDHIGGLMGGQSFENAKIHVPEKEWSFWTTPSLDENVPQENRDTVRLIQAIASSVKDRVQTHADGADLGDGLTFHALPGHTPGHAGVLLSSKGEDMFIVGDAVISVDIHFSHPDVFYALDGDPELTVKTRLALLNSLAESGTCFAATHIPFPGIGTVQCSKSGFAFKAKA